MSSTTPFAITPCLNNHELNAAIEILGGPNHSFLKKVLNESENIKLDPQSKQLLYNKTEILQSIDEISFSFFKSLTKGKRLLLPRLINDKSTAHPESEDILDKVFDSFENHILNGLQTIERNQEVNEKAPAYWSRTLILLGASAMPALDIKELPAYINKIIVIETQPRNLAVGLLLSSLTNIVHDAKLYKKSIQFIFDSDEENMKHRLRSELVGLQPVSLNGLTLIESPVTNPQIKLIESWLLSSEGISQAVLGGFGSEVDEINQLLQAIYSSVTINKRYLLEYQDERKNLPVVLVASGPSLDSAVPWLKQHQSKLQIIASGSSLGVLIRNQILPSAAVFLERSSIIYENDLQELIAEGHDLSNIPLIASMTLDPRVCQHFGSVAWFHRPLSSTMAFFADESSAKLFQSGPQSANAALEAVLHLGHRRILAVGCDFSAETKSYPRAKQAIGETPRDLNLPVRGRNGKTVYSSPSLLDASHYFDNALIAYGAEVSSPAVGVAFERASLSIESLDDDLARKFCNLSNFADLWDQLPFKQIDLELQQQRINSLRSCFLKYIQLLSSEVTSAPSWSTELLNKMNGYLKLDETNLTSEEACIKRLIHYPVYLVIQGLHDSSDETWEDARMRALSNFDWLKNVYTKYFSILLLVIENAGSIGEFNWSKVKDMLD